MYSEPCPTTPYDAIRTKLKGLEQAVEFSAMDSEEEEKVHRERGFNQNCALWERLGEVLDRVERIEAGVYKRLEALESKVFGLLTPTVSSRGTSASGRTAVPEVAERKILREREKLEETLKRAEKMCEAMRGGEEEEEEEEEEEPPTHLSANNPKGQALLEECRYLAGELKSQLATRDPSFIQRAKDDLIQVKKIVNAAKLATSLQARTEGYSLAFDIVTKVRAMLQSK